MASLKTKDNTSSFDDMTLFYKFFLRLIGLIPFDGRDFNFLGSRLLLTYYVSSGCIHWSMFVFYVINGNRIPEVDTICEIVLVIGAELRFYLLIHHRFQLADLLNESREIWQLFHHKDDHLAVRLFEGKVRRLFKLLLCTCCFINIMYSGGAAMATLKAARLNDSHTRYLPSKWYSENGPNLWPGYKFNFVLQTLVIQNACVYGPTIDTAAPFFIMIGAGYFRALQHRIRRIADNESEASADLEIVECAKLHQRIFNFCSRIDKITRKLFFVQLLATVYNLSLAGFQLAGTNPDRFKFIPITMYQLGGLFICQWAPQHLIDESSAIALATYSVSFTWMRRRVGKMLVVIMARSQRPFQMTAAGVVNLSLEKFASMLTSAMSFFTVLRNSNV